MENVDHGLLEHWLLNIRNVQRLHLDELKVCTGIACRRRDWGFDVLLPDFCCGWRRGEERRSRRGLYRLILTQLRRNG